MYGSYGLYSGNKSNFSCSNLYKPAGIVNISNSSSFINGVNTSNSTIFNTSVVEKTMDNNVSFQQYTNNSFRAQHIEYQQNPAPVTISVRQTN